MVTLVNDITWYILYYSNDSLYTSTYPTYGLYIYIYIALIWINMITICHILYYHMGYAFGKSSSSSNMVCTKLYKLFYEETTYEVIAIDILNNY